MSRMPILKTQTDDTVDDRPLSRDDLARMRRTPRIAIIRRAQQLTQEAFAARYGIPLGTLRDWEQGRSEPDQAAQAYLKVIASAPDLVAGIMAATSPYKGEAI